MTIISILLNLRITLPAFFISITIFIGLFLRIFSIGFYIHQVFPHPDPKLSSPIPAFAFYDIYIMVGLLFPTFILFTFIAAKLLMNFNSRKAEAQKPSQEHDKQEE